MWPATARFSIPSFGFNPETLQREARERLEMAKEQLQNRRFKAVVRDEVVEHEHVAEGLVATPKKIHSDFIVIGDTGRSTIARACWEACHDMSCVTPLRCLDHSQSKIEGLAGLRAFEQVSRWM